MKRVCHDCGRAKEESAFLAGKAKRLSRVCAPCRKSRQKRHIKSFYRGLSTDERHRITQRRRAQHYGAAHQPYSRTEIFARWGHRCGYGCNASAEHLDHITPLSRGGADAEANMIPACAACNLSKGALTLAEWALRDFPPPF
ncbi:HNH endonuclease [Streptomyces sp. CA-250714]|uniref:HNH endonuclease n=1 Tax=Streptomyces sp. CA-250714 TaxID=3240060 RepID=UPI003D90F4FB